MDHPVHTVMSRTGSFPLRVAYDLIEKYNGGSLTVFDPFCGKGTTLLAARLFGCPAYGLDIAPEAVICSLAKLVDVTVGPIREYIHGLQITPPDRTAIVPSVRLFFNPRTLDQILCIRDQLMRDSRSRNEKHKSNAMFSLACLLGILHGHSSYSLSIPSAHAYSMAPAYVRRFAAKHGLKAPLRDVRVCLTEKVERCLRIPLPRPVPYGVRRGCALGAATLFPELRGRVDLVITSPPYLDAQTYAKDNWLRLWFLGYNYKTVRREYIETAGVARYKDLMFKVFEQLSLMLRRGGRLVCVSGDVRLRRRGTEGDGIQIFATGLCLAELCERKGLRLRVEDYEEHRVPSSQRYFHSLTGSNGHSKHDLIERVFVARRV